MHPGAFLHDVFDGDADAGDELAEFSDAPGSVAHSHFELDQAPLGRQPALQASTQDCGVYVAARQDAYHPVIVRDCCERVRL